MLLRKSIILAFILLIMFILNTSFASHAYVYNEYAGQPGVDSAENVEKANGEVGGRGADGGYITPAQHVAVNTAIRTAFIYNKAEEVLDYLDMDPETDSILIAGIEKHKEAGSPLTGFNIQNLTALTGGVSGHYGITNGSVYVDRIENMATAGVLMKHELYELIQLLAWAEKEGLTRQQLVDKLKDPSFAEEAKTMLQKIHDENPYKLGKGEYTVVAQHMPNLGYRGAALDPAKANVGDIAVSNDADIVLTKNQFFETHADDTRIITLPATVIIENAVTPEEIQKLIDEQKVSVAILVADETQYEEVKGKFEASLFETLTQAASLAFVQINNDNILRAVVELFRENQGNLANCTLTNLNKAIVEAIGVQI